MPRIELSDDNSWGYKIVPTWSDHLTDWIAHRYARFAGIGFSVVAAVWVSLHGIEEIFTGDYISWAIDILLAILNGFLAGWNFRRYQRDFWK